ncbi:MAG: GNAT family N-acetyltransferase [Xenococcaceae cyanobacterium MO_167.B27]|nr:GNAT family N-acetyltransferase [Xenococcaceae cyanobacterium MO_167.B27]
MSSTLPLGYSLRYCGERIAAAPNRILLTKFMELAYQELFPEARNFNHLALTVNEYLSEETPVWWVDNSVSETVACLWMGNAIDQVNGERYSHIFLIFVASEHRRRGIGTSLINQAQAWAKDAGSCQIGIQVFADNQPALQLYRKMGFQTQSLLMLKSLHLSASSEKKMPEL